MLCGFDSSGQTVETVHMPKDGQPIDVSLPSAKLQVLFPLVVRGLYSYHWTLSPGQAAESTQMLNISYLGAAGQ